MTNYSIKTALNKSSNLATFFVPLWKNNQVAYFCTGTFSKLVLSRVQTILFIDVTKVGRLERLNILWELGKQASSSTHVMKEIQWGLLSF
jgi:hypothetical protein